MFQVLLHLDRQCHIRHLCDFTFIFLTQVRCATFGTCILVFQYFSRLVFQCHIRHLCLGHSTERVPHSANSSDPRCRLSRSITICHIRHLLRRSTRRFSRCLLATFGTQYDVTVMVPHSALGISYVTGYSTRLVAGCYLGIAPAYRGFQALLHHIPWSDLCHIRHLCWDIPQRECHIRHLCFKCCYAQSIADLLDLVRCHIRHLYFRYRFPSPFYSLGTEVKIKVPHSALMFQVLPYIIIKQINTTYIPTCHIRHLCFRCCYSQPFSLPFQYSVPHSALMFQVSPFSTLGRATFGTYQWTIWLLCHIRHGLLVRRVPHLTCHIRHLCFRCCCAIVCVCLHPSPCHIRYLYFSVCTDILCGVPHLALMFQVLLHDRMTKLSSTSCATFGTLGVATRQRRGRFGCRRGATFGTYVLGVAPQILRIPFREV